MLRYQLCYRQASGGLQGYIGYGFSDYSARADALIQVKRDCGERREVFEDTRVIEDQKRLTLPELKAVQRQWKQIKSAKREAGHSIV